MLALIKNINIFSTRLNNGDYNLNI